VLDTFRRGENSAAAAQTLGLDRTRCQELYADLAHELPAIGHALALPYAGPALRG
jgi:hypothetical protein